MKIFKIFYLVIISLITISHSTLKSMRGWENCKWDPHWETLEERERYRSYETQNMIREEERLQKLSEEEGKRIKSKKEIAASNLLKKWLNASPIKTNIINTTIINKDLNHLNSIKKNLDALGINIKNSILSEIKREKSRLNVFTETHTISKLDRIENLVNENLLGHEETEKEALYAPEKRRENFD